MLFVTFTVKKVPEIGLKKSSNWRRPGEGGGGDLFEGGLYRGVVLI